MNITLETLRQHQQDLQAKFGTATVAYGGVSQTMFSIARHYGGTSINGKHFTYNPTDDSLIRDDVLKWMSKRLREGENSK